MQDGCIVCRWPVLETLFSDPNLPGGTSRADALYTFEIVQCARCGHMQKALDAAWHACMRTLYEKEYDMEGRHVKVNRVGDKVVLRDTVVVEKLRETLRLGVCGKLLDFGCGDGLFLGAFGGAFSDWQLYGYDVGDLRSDRIRALPGVRYLSGDQLANSSETFDLITLGHVLEHLPDPIGTLRLLGSRLRPNGRVIVRVPDVFSVYTDFFFMEHCSHFVAETLTYALRTAGFGDVIDLPGMAAVEIAVAAGAYRPNDRTMPALPDYRIADLADRARQCVAWAVSLPDLIRRSPAAHKGIFGVSGTGFWLGALLDVDTFAFFVDEDPAKMGRPFTGRPVIGLADVPANATVFVTFNNPEAAARIVGRLRAERSDVCFVVPGAPVAA